MKQIIENLRGLGRGRLIALGGTGLGIVGALLLVAMVAMAPQYRPLVTDATAGDAASMVEALEKSGFAPRISEDGTMISLPEADLARARMALAESGLPASGNAGYEIFDNAGGLGMNSFLQRVNRLRALEGELARSAQTLEAVESARVHLVLPERESFSQDRPEPSASVILKTRRGVPLERRQAIAVRNLVAAAVPGLSPDRVVVLSASGETILAGEESVEGIGAASARAAIEDRMARNIESILSARVGAGNARVRVAAELANSREVVVRESFDPDQQVARSTSALAEQSQGRNGSNGNVDVANNMPGVENGGGAGGGREESRSKTLDETQFEIGNTRSETVTEAGSIKRLTVAVLVNGTMEDGEYVERSPEEIARLEALVRSAVGVVEERGDAVTVDSMRFVDAEGFSGEETGGFTDLLARNSGTLIRGLLALAAVALILVLGVRPAMARLSGERSGRETAAAGAAAATAGAADAVEGAAPGVSETGAADTVPEGERTGEDYVPIASVKGDVMKRYIEELGTLVDGNREEVLRALRILIQQKN